MSSATCARFGPRSARRSRLSRSIPTRPTGGRCGRCSRTPPLSAIPFTSSAARTPRSTRSDASASGWPGANAARAPGARGRSSWKQQLYHARHRLLRGRERLSARDRRWLCTLFEHEPLIAEAWGLKEAFRAIYRSRDRRGAEVRLERFLTGCRLAAIPSFEAFAQGVRALARGTACLLRRAVDEWLRGRGDQQDQGDQTPGLRPTSFEGFRRRVLVACG
jgi:transposase